MNNAIKIILPIVLLTFACNKPIPDSVDRVVAHAGDNKKELIKVLRHYNKPQDSLKFKAACFLIANIDSNYSYYSDKFPQYDTIFSMLHRTYSVGEAAALWDSLCKVLKPLNKRLVYDIDTITSGYLIENIDRAFDVWATRPWSNKYTFNEFCEYILPYRCENEHLKNWRKAMWDRYKSYTDTCTTVEGAYSLIYNDIHKWGIKNFWSYPMAITYDNIIKSKRGRCSDEANMYAFAMRAMGIPCAIDFSPRWGNKNYIAHSWITLISANRTASAIQGKKPRDGTSIDASVISLNSTTQPNQLPTGVYIDSVRWVVKVYRDTYSIMNRYDTLVENPAENVPPFFQNTKIIDVTRDYLSCYTLKADLFPSNEKLSYLAVFDLKDEWFPVQVSVIKDNKATFKDMGGNSIYLPVFYKNKRAIAAADPFILDAKGNKTTIVADVSHQQTLKLVRKYPLFSNIANYMNYMTGGRFEGSDTRNFKNARVLYEIKKAPYYETTVSLKNPHAYRYIRYIANDNSYVDVAEIKLFSGKNEIKISSDYFASIGIQQQQLYKVFDNNYESCYTSPPQNKGGWIAIDLGEGNTRKVTKIVFWPRNDTNVIFPGNTYELFYWDNRWLSLGKQTAAKNYLIYNNAPENALFWLHCHNGGNEERIFTYENNRQKWW